MNDTGLVRYDRMCHAIAEAHAIDEVKDLRDKALALEHYARQAMNMEAERRASEIRLRAERKCGELLQQQAETGERATKENNLRIGPKSYDATSVPTLSDLGISRDQSSKWQRLANVPEADFEDALRNPDVKPTTNGVLRKASGDGGKMHPAAVWLWARLRDFERDNIAGIDPSVLLGEMTDAMHPDIARIAPVLADYLTRLTEQLDDQ